MGEQGYRVWGRGRGGGGGTGIEYGVEGGVAVGEQG